MPASERACDITISPAVVFKSLVLVIAFLLLMHAFVQVAEFVFGRDHLMGLTPLFDLDREYNVPASYSAAVLLFTALALAVVARSTRQARAPFVRHWTVLAVIFVYLAIDEFGRLHEMWGKPLEAWMAEWRNREFLGGALRHAWVIPASLVALVVGLSYIRFLRHLPVSIRMLFAASGMGFVAGAAGMEMIGASYSAAVARRTLGFEAIVAIEEGLEMISVAVFLYAVLKHLDGTSSSVRIRFGTFPRSTALPLMDGHQRIVTATSREAAETPPNIADCA